MEPTWAALPLSLAAFLAAAKAHGRQLRLERERAGVPHVVFGGSNPPFVERLWRRERRWFWSAAPVLAVVLGAAAGASPPDGWPAWVAAAVAALLWAPTAVFVVLGLWSWRRTDLDVANRRDSVAWRLLCLALAMATVVAYAW